MSCFISFSLLFDILFKGGSQVNAGLIGQTQQHPKDIAQLVRQIALRLFSGLERLVAIAASHNAGHLAHLFGEDGHIGQFAEISYPHTLYPGINLLLCLFYRHRTHSLFFVSIHIVTGPSFTNSTCISAPKTPVATCCPISSEKRRQKASYMGTATS